MTADKMWNKALHVWNTGARELDKLGSYIDRTSFIRCVEEIAACQGRVITIGVGTSGAAAKKIAHSLSCIERPAFFLDASDGVHGGLGAAQPGDIALLISKGGNTREIINVIPALQHKKVTIIGITENEESVLAESSSILLKVKIEREADSFNMLATTSTMAVTAVWDAICITLMEYTEYSREQFAVIHPGGAVGDRLLKEKNRGDHV